VIPCVIYSAKSTEDVRGSLATQMTDCRDAASAAGGREIVAEYHDEAVSGFNRSRGPGLSAALAQVQALAHEHGSAELWTQHSDRLARGDGRSARHLVEIALWALKAGVSIRTVEDVDTFRDLLYAVVTGQRNHEDSRRKGAASAAGIKRAVYRGEYVGQALDGYRVVVTADRKGHVTKKLDTDPARKQVFAFIFRMARRGANSGEIARALNRRGWLTSPYKRTLKPAPFSPAYIRWILTNPRYAGLAVYKGEIVGKGRWPAYISRQDHERIATGVRTYKPRRLPREPFLLAHLAGCALCESYMITATGVLRKDGTRSRRYVCNEHRFGRCDSRPIDALVVDHVFVAHLNRFLGGPEDSHPYRPSPGFPRELLRGEPDERWEQIEPIASVAAELKMRIQKALAEGDDGTAELLLDELVGHRERLYRLTHDRTPETEIRSTAVSEDPFTLLLDFYSWAGRDLAGELRGEPAATERLNRVLRRWFSRVMLRATPQGIAIAPLPRADSAATNGSSAAGEPTPAYAQLDSWRVALQIARFGHRWKEPWPTGEIVHALRVWSEEHGRVPRVRDWKRMTPGHPNYSTVLDRFGTWYAALAAADLTPEPVVRHCRRGADGGFIPAKSTET
jgi:DNA invertase Pin-like site-specific DNA recombinase